ncbi:MAG: hypothetical protein H6718_14455 [Polyangiaceae bacterium]|nr:hypothetical protein [Polyangiaceae bacterium]MCB9606105.1 hypothetical protein [Polyangiaceae bacterium]
MRRWLKRALVTSSVTCALGVGLIGFAHTKAGRPLLGWLQGAPGCPALEGQADAAAIEAYRTQTLQKHLADANAEARTTPALSFSLGKATRDDVQAFAAKHHASCKETASQAALKCEGFDAAAQVSDVYAQFDTEGRLVALDAFSTLAPQAAVAYFEQRKQALSRDVGPATKQSGVKPVTAELATAYSRSGVEFAYKRYNAKLSVMNFGKRGIQVREQYQWLAPAELAAR